MRSSKTFLIAVLGALQPILLQPVSALTLDYATNSYALAGACWYDPFLGFICLGDSDHDENSNGPSYASAFYEIQYGGKANISSRADASTEPNGVILSTELAGSYELDAGWVLLEAFYQDANSTTEGLLQITEFPPGTPCSLDINITFPKSSWTGFLAWQLYIESSLSYFLAGRDELGDYGYHSGRIPAYAGESIYVFLGIAGSGYADHEIGEHLGYGTLSINAALTAGPHPADLNSDGCVDFYDFALLSLQWLRQGSEESIENWCQKADIDQDGQVDANDLILLARYWLMFPN